MCAFFYVGGTAFVNEHYKVLNYANSMCQVNASSYKRYQIEMGDGWYICYGPVWDVHHGTDKKIFARVEGDKLSPSYLDALKKSKEYQVTKHTKQRKPFKIHLIENFDGSFRNKCESLFSEDMI
jgi:hypothetical protein